MHPAETLMADRVVYFKAGKPHVAFVTCVHSAHCANLVYYCPVTHAWQEASNVTFGFAEGGDYFTNPEG